MIEDDLCQLVRGATDRPDVPIYPRYIPLDQPECIAIQVIGGRAVSSTVKRAIHEVSVMGVARDQPRARELMKWARDYLTTEIPAEAQGGRWFYRAVPLASGSDQFKSTRGPTYIETITLEVEASL